jgi:hypothetical protein
MFSRDTVMKDINRFALAMPEMYEIDSCEVYEKPIDGKQEVNIGYRFVKDGGECVVASTYITDDGGNLEQKPATLQMMAITGNSLHRFHTIGQCMDHLGIALREK